jgi:hypothetical protein
MPLVQGSQPSELGGVAHLPEPPDPGPVPSWLEVGAAAERQSNLVGSLYDRLSNPMPEAKGAPGFDPLASIPKGYEQYADKFLDAESPKEMAWIKQRISSELRDREVIARAGKWGFVASMAAGMTDPLTLASMLIPGAGETRLAQAGRLALTNAATTAGQELLQQQLSVTRTAQESMFNVAGSAVLGGILGAAIKPRMPLRTLDELGERLSAELHSSAAGDSVLGPEQRSVLDTALPSDVSEGPVPPGMNPDEMRVRPRYIPPPPEGPTKPTPGNIPTIQPERMSLLEAIAVTKAADAETHGLSLNEAIAQGLDRADLKAARFGSRPVFTRGGASFDAMAEALHQHDYPVTDEAGAYSPNALLDAIDMELRGKKQYSTAADDYLAALEAHEHGAMRAGQETPELQYERELERDAAMFEARSDEHINPYAESTAGAAAVARPGLTANTIAGRAARAIAEGPVGRVAPGLRVLTSPSLEARNLVQSLAETREILEKNLHGVATPTAIETLLRRYEGAWWQAWKARGDLFRAYRERIAGAGGDAQALSRRQFNAEVSAAMRRGDQHPVPEIVQAAQRTRAIVFDPLKARAQKLGLLPEELETTGADSYLMRQYDARKIRENLGRWMDTLTEGFRAQGVDTVEARDIAHKATRNVLGSERGTMDWRILEDEVPASGRFKERTLKLPDKLLEPYLNSDIDHLSHSYLRSMAPEVEMTERFGSRDLKDQFDDVRDEYARLIEQARVAGDEPGMAALDKRRDADIEDLSAIRDRLYGLYGQPKDPGAFFVRAGRLMRSVNALRLLGAATLAHVPDLANIVTKFGLPNTIAGIAKLATSWDAIQLTRQEARRIGAGLDMVTNLTASMLGDYGAHSQFAEQRVLARATRGFTIATGETPLITMVQSLASAVGQDELLRSATRFASGKLLSQLTFAKLASAGIDKPMLRRIAAEAAQHGREVNGLKFGMSDLWKDQGAAQAFESAIIRDAHGMTLSPGSGDTPLTMSSEVGKLVLQFKSFAFAAVRHVLMPISQGAALGDPRAASGLLALLAAGYASYWAKQKAAGQPIETNPRRIAGEVLDKSNLLGWTAEALYPILWSLGMKDFSRWSDRDAVETIGGPTAGTLAAIYNRRLPARLTGNPEEGEQTFNRSDLHFVRRLMPGQNLWYLRRQVNALEDSIGDLFDLSGISQEERAERGQVADAGR